MGKKSGIDINITGQSSVGAGLKSAPTGSNVGTGYYPAPTAIRIFFVFVTLILSAICAVPSAFADDKIVAVVNKDVITSKDMNDFLNFTRVQLARQYQGRELEEKRQALKVDLMNRLIEDCLILQEAKKEKVEIDPNRIKGRMDEIRREYGSDAAFQVDLRKQGMVPADIEKKIREQMLIFTIIDRKVKSKILVRPEEVTSYYNAHTLDFFLPETREVEAYALENEDMAKTFSYNLIAGQKLTDLAARYPMTVNKLQVPKGGGVKNEIEEAVFKLGVGEVSAPVGVDDKYYVFRLENIIVPGQISLSDAQDDIGELLYSKKMEEGFAAWMVEMKNNAYIKVIEADK
ncbi:MAG: SurA N-terminal domain-containing protein [Candidatus Omnitrophota bacterium]|nr:SurA N-terminal domain-containing protein [Candidatus Omnitrophota bacterium]